MKIKTAKQGVNRFGVRKYATTKSESVKNLIYNVAKVRVPNTKRYRYVCTCPDFFFRQRVCKHIKSFKLSEK